MTSHYRIESSRNRRAVQLDASVQAGLRLDAGKPCVRPNSFPAGISA